MGFTITFIQILFQALFIAILGRVLMSWIDPTGGTKVSLLLYEITEPILKPIRSIVPTLGMFDISPIIAMLLLNIIEQALLSALR
jgi:YggT family protein